MSFYSNALFYYPDTPACVTAKDVAGFLRDLKQTRFGSDITELIADINWAPQISEEVRPFFSEDSSSTQSPTLPWWKRLLGVRTDPEIAVTTSVIKEIEPDYSFEGEADELIAELLNLDKSIGRLVIAGDLTDEQYAWFQEAHPSGDEINFRPQNWGLQFGQITLSVINGWEVDGMGVVPAVEVGTMACSIGGDGYFFPWTFREWVERFGKDSLLQEVCDLCRKTWPVDPAPPSEDFVKARRVCEGLWPYDDVEAPLDWAWGPNET